MSVATLDTVNLAGPESVLASRGAGILSGWEAWLRQELDTEWRPAEWRQDLDLFDGDLDNPRTRAWKCRVAACSSLTSNKAGRCSPCAKIFTASELSAQDFDASHVPTPRVSMTALKHCTVERDGKRCARRMHSRGLCSVHYAHWRLIPDRENRLADWIAQQTPHTAVPPCSVRGCDADETSETTRLCRTHQTKWRSHVTANGLAGTDQEWQIWLQHTPPYLAQNQFSLAPLTPVVRLEILYALQQRDARGQSIDPTQVRWAVHHFVGLPSIALAEATLPDPQVLGRGSPNRTSFMRETRWSLQVALDDFRGIDPKDKSTWDLVAVGTPSQLTATGRRSQPGTADFEQISQSWLRELLLEWARATSPESRHLLDRLRSCIVASKTLSLRAGGGQEIGELQFSDVNAVVDAYRVLKNEDGTLMATGTRRDYLRFFFDVLDYGQAAGLLDGLGAGFARHSTHRIKAEEVNEDEIGKAIPESVIRQLDAQLGFLGEGLTYGNLAPEDVELMFQTAYIVLRDTGRRPRELCGLRADCLEFDDGEYSLLWDNRKARRLRRRLPIASQTVEAIKRWLERRAELELPAGSHRFLFPPRTAASGITHLDGRMLYRALRAWVEALPLLDSEETGKDGRPLPFDRSLIYPYAFRHSYAQRHADAGVPVDVLRELMDHKKIDVTMGYYKVSLKRKREAVQTLRLQVVDRTGRAAPMSSGIAYEARSVAVPFGNCKEPSNVKAGGKACPIRFQCAGCGFYRPDPSYLPAIEDHVRSLKSDRETAQAMEADEFVIRNLSDQIDAFRDVTTSMRENLQNLPPDERQRIEEASAVLRKVRAVDGRRLLPLSVVDRSEGRR